MKYPTCGEISCEECNDRYEAAQARIAELERALAKEQQRHQWRDIETAPKEDEQDILLGYWWRNLFDPEAVQPIFKQCVGRWTNFNGGGWVTSSGGNVTHWQPLPQPPERSV